MFAKFRPLIRWTAIFSFMQILALRAAWATLNHYSGGVVIRYGEAVEGVRYDAADRIRFYIPRLSSYYYDDSGY